MRTKPLVLGIGFLLFGVASLCFYAFLLRQGLASKDWPTTLGTVTEVSVARTAVNVSKYKPRITFKYVHEGNEYTSDRMSPDFVQTTYSRQSDAVDAVAEYSVGQTVTVHVDPAEPARGTLTVGVSPMLHAMLVAVAMGLLLGTFNMRRGMSAGPQHLVSPAAAPPQKTHGTAT